MGLNIALAWQDLTLFEKLLEKGANPNFHHKDGRSFLGILIESRYNKYVAAVVKSKQFDLEVKDLTKEGHSPIHWSLLSHNIECFFLLLASKININLQNNQKKHFKDLLESVSSLYTKEEKNRISNALNSIFPDEKRSSKQLSFQKKSCDRNKSCRSFSSS